MIDATVGGLVFSTVTAILGMVGLSSAMIGYLVDHCNVVERIVLFVSGILMIMPGLETDLPGLIVFAVIVFIQRKRKAKQAA